MHIPGKLGPAPPAGGGPTLTVSLTRPVLLAVRLMLVAVALFALSAPARADITFEVGNNPQAGQENILFDDATGNPVFGTTNNSGLTVRFSSTSETTLVANGGQARVESGDDDETISNLRIALDDPNGVFTSLIFNPFDGDGTALVTVEVLGLPDETFEYELGNGENFLTIVAIDGQKIVSVTIDAESGFAFQDARQFRIGGAQIIPEPSTMALAFVGVAGLGLKGLRRLRRRPATAPA